MSALLASWELLGWPATRVLTAAAIAAGFVLLWFLFRPRPPRLDVASHVLWDQVVPRRRDPLRKELLMLLLQLAMVLALALALGDPRRSAEPEAAQEGPALAAPLDRIHVVDRSLSMTAQAGDGSRLDAVASAIVDDLDGLPETVRVALVGAGRDAEIMSPLGADRQRLRLALRTLHSDGLGSSLSAALALAASMPTRRPETRVELWTDDPAAAETLAAWSAASGIPATLRVPFGPAPNLAVTAFDLRAAEGIPAEEEALVRVANPSPWPATATLALETEDARLGEARITLAPGEELVRRYRFQPLAGSGVEAVVRGAVFDGGPARGEQPLGDGLAADDRAYAWVQPVRPVTVWLVSDGNRYLERVLTLLPGVRLTRVTPEAYRNGQRSGASDADVVFFDGFVPLPKRDGPLPARSVLLSPPASRSPVPVLGVAEAPVVTDWELDHPLFHGLVLRDLKVERSMVLDPAPGDVRLLGTTTGALVVGRESGAERLVVWGFDLGASDLPLRLAFPQTIVNVVLWMRDARPSEPPLGGRHRLEDPYWLDEAEAVTVTDLRQQAYARRAEDPVALSRARWEVPIGDGPTPYSFPRPGLFAVQRGEELASVGVNLFSLEEARLAELPEGSTERIPAPRARDAAPEDDSTPWLLLACGVGLVGLLEFGLYTR